MAAYINDWSVSWGQMAGPLVEAGGGAVLAELVLDGLIQRELAKSGLTVGDVEIDRERAMLRESLDPDPDQAERLLGLMRRQRGLGQERFTRMIWRAAGLRALARAEGLGEEVTEAAIRQEYDLVYGDRYEVRVVVCENLNRAGDLVKQARGGRSFIELAEEYRRETGQAGASPGGAGLGVLSLADANYPVAVRTAVGRMAVGEVSDPVSLEGGFAVLKLERKINGEKVGFDDVRQELSQRIRLRSESMRMRQKAKAFMDAAEVVVLDPVLKKAWDQAARGADGLGGLP